MTGKGLQGKEAKEIGRAPEVPWTRRKGLLDAGRTVGRGSYSSGSSLRGHLFLASSMTLSRPLLSTPPSFVVP